MKSLVLGGALALLVPTGLLLRAPVESAQDAKAKSTSYMVDPVHSSVVFRVKHLGTSWFYGHFKAIGGSFVFDEQKPEAGSVSIEIPAESIDTNNPDRDEHVRGPDFFSAKEFPKITFKSKSVKKTKDGFDVSGEMSMHGVTKSVTASAEYVGKSDFPQAGPRAGFWIKLDLKRSDFGMSYGLPDMLGDDIHVEIGIEGTPQK